MKGLLLNTILSVPFCPYHFLRSPSAYTVGAAQASSQYLRNAHVFISSYRISPKCGFAPQIFLTSLRQCRSLLRIGLFDRISADTSVVRKKHEWQFHW